MGTLTTAISAPGNALSKVRVVIGGTDSVATVYFKVNVTVRNRCGPRVFDAVRFFAIRPLGRAVIYDSERARKLSWQIAPVQILTGLRAIPVMTRVVPIRSFLQFPNGAW